MIWFASLTLFASALSGTYVNSSFTTQTVTSYRPVNASGDIYAEMLPNGVNINPLSYDLSQLRTYLLNQPSYRATLVDLSVTGNEYLFNNGIAYLSEESVTYNDYIKIDAVYYQSENLIEFTFNSYHRQDVAPSWYAYMPRNNTQYAFVYTSVASTVDGGDIFTYGYDMDTTPITTCNIKLCCVTTLGQSQFINESGYSRGYNVGYDDGYSYGESVGYANGNSIGHAEGYGQGLESGQTSGYSSGYTVGYSEGLLDSGGGYTFDRLFKGIVDTPIYFLQSLFGWSMFGEGVALLEIAFTLITALVVISLLKKVFK